MSQRFRESDSYSSHGSSDTKCSELLRQASFDIISKSPVPLSIYQIKVILRRDYPELYVQISNKCDDYTRIIISNTDAFGIVRYKSVNGVSNVDKRAAFYGYIKNHDLYPASDWTRISDKKAKQSRARKTYTEPKIAKRKQTKVASQPAVSSPSEALEFDDCSPSPFNINSLLNQHEPKFMLKNIKECRISPIVIA